MPTFGANAPLYYYSIPESERPSRCSLTSDQCVIDNEFYFVRGCIELHVHGATEQFIWGAWVSLSRSNFETFRNTFDREKRSHIAPFFGWLSAELPLYPSTENLKTMVHLRDNNMRPYIEIEPTQHLLAVEQRDGITVERVASFYAFYERLGQKQPPT